jgi:hypothetical protein
VDFLAFLLAQSNAAGRERIVPRPAGRDDLALPPAAADVIILPEATFYLPKEARGERSTYTAIRRRFWNRRRGP